MHLLGGRPLGPMLAHKVCNDEKRMLWAGVSGVVTAVGCRSHPEIPVNDEQSLVMEHLYWLRASVQKSPSFRRLILTFSILNAL